jgi:hypothetical protein
MGADHLVEHGQRRHDHGRGEAYCRLLVGGECLLQLGGSRIHFARFEWSQELRSGRLLGEYEALRLLRMGQVSAEAEAVGLVLPALVCAKLPIR